MVPMTSGEALEHYTSRIVEVQSSRRGSLFYIFRFLRHSGSTSAIHSRLIEIYVNRNCREIKYEERTTDGTAECGSPTTDTLNSDPLTLHPPLRQFILPPLYSRLDSSLDPPNFL